MPRSVTVYRVFIGSPGGLEPERKRFRDVLEKYNRVHARHHDVEFEPVGWEDTLPGKGRPQAQINRDLETCDYAVFAFHDRWGSKTGNGDLVGTEEEWQIAERLYSREGGYQIRQIALYFKGVSPAQLKDPGEELKRVLAFRNKILSEKQHLYGSFIGVDSFAEQIEKHLATWLARHLQPVNEAAFAELAAIPNRSTRPTAASFAPDFEFWMAEAAKELAGAPPDYTVMLSHFSKALQLARDGSQAAKALLNKGLTLAALDRSSEEIAVYDDLIARFGTSTAPALEEAVAVALLNKGITLGTLGRSGEAIAMYDNLIGRFDNSDVMALQEQVAKAHFNKGVRLGALNRSAEAIVVYDGLIRRFDHSELPVLQESVARALLNKGVRLGALGRFTEAVAVYDDLVARFGTSEAATLQERVAKALLNKACVFAKQARVGACISTLDKWALAQGVFDCEVIAKDSDFDAIRSRPKFVQYLRRRAC